MGAQKEKGMHVTAMQQGRPHVEVMAESGGPPPQPPGGSAMTMDAATAVAQVSGPVMTETSGMPPAPPADGNRAFGETPGLDSHRGAPPPRGKGKVKLAEYTCSS